MVDQPQRPESWSDAELDLIVADYFSMLSDELRGIEYNKSAHRRELMTRVARGEKSIEFKHANITAVLQMLGLPWINGYKPRVNFQAAIFDAIDRFLSGNPKAATPEVVMPGLDEAANLFIEDKPLLTPKVALPESLRRLIRKFDPVERDFRNRKLGKAGEELVFQTERRRLVELGREDLARKVRWVSEEIGDGAGYDVLSFDQRGTEKMIEVKTTLGIQTTPFYLTRNEICLAVERPDAFRLYRLYEFSAKPRMFEIAPPLEAAIHLEALSFKASFD